jgi:predicted N-acetyltransferase YhbS
VLSQVRNFFVPNGQFRMARRGTLPQCNIRLLREVDIEACEEIYRLNEAKHFPPGYFPRLSTWLRNREALVVVVEQDSVVRGFGGVNAELQNGHHCAALTFGMVHPVHQRNGLGTALLAARLALLHKAACPSSVVLTTTGGSENFYSRFGFKFVNSIQASPEYLQKHYFVKVSAEDKARCVAALQSVSVQSGVFEAELPSFASFSVSPRTVSDA